MDKFISEGYLLKAMDLPEEFADQLLQPNLKDEPELPQEELQKGRPNPNFKKFPERANPQAPNTLSERIEQIQPLSETVIRDVNDCANLDRIPENILLRARGCVWLAILYELFSVYEPESINIPFLARLTNTNMQGFFCVCSWNSLYDNETMILHHLRNKHPLVQKTLIVVRRTIDPYEYD